MKIRKILASGIAACMSFAAFAGMNAFASDTVVDFEDGNFSFATMKTDDGGDVSILSVVDFNGSKQLKVDVQDCSLLPKVQFDLNSMVGTDNLSDVDRIQMDVTFEGKDGVTPPGWIGGALGTAADGDTPAWNQSDYDGGEYDNAVSQPITVERKFLLPASRLVSGTENTIALLMRWASEVPYNMYIDNIVFLDKDGNQMALTLAAAPAEEAAPADAPAADSDSTSATTGNVAAPAIAAVMLLSGTAAICFKRRKK